MKHFLTFCALALTVLAFGQQNISFRDVNITSPVVNNDNSVTFLVHAPKAEQVRVLGDWEANGGWVTLSQQVDGLWSGTTAVLPSEMYTYRVEIDGVMGLDPTNPFVRRDVGTQFSIFFISGGVGDYYQVRDVAHGAMTQCWYESKAAGMARRLSIYTPPMYDKNKKERYPVLYLLHGSGGDETAWVELGNTARIMDNLIAEGKIAPMIVVMPNGNFAKSAAPGETAENLSFRPVMSNQITGNYKDGQYELAFDEIIRYTDSHYRTLADKKHRAVAGLSMGGFHTLYIALNHPEKFNYIGLMSAGLNIPWFDQTAPAYSDIQGKLRRLEKSGYELFWISIGREDFLYEQNTDFRHMLDDMNFRYEYNESTRGHMWCNWRQYLVSFAQKLWH